MRVSESIEKCARCEKAKKRGHTIQELVLLYALSHTKLLCDDDDDDRRQREILATISHLSIFDLLFTIFTFYIYARSIVRCCRFALFFLCSISFIFVGRLIVSVFIWYGNATVCIFRLILVLVSVSFCAVYSSLSRFCFSLFHFILVY